MESPLTFQMNLEYHFETPINVNQSKNKNNTIELCHYLRFYD